MKTDLIGREKAQSVACLISNSKVVIDTFFMHDILNSCKKMHNFLTTGSLSGKLCVVPRVGHYMK